MIVCPWNTSFAATASALSPAHKKQLQCVIQQAPLPREECAPVVIPGLRRPWGAAMRVMVRLHRRRRSTIGNHVAYATVFSKPPVAPIQHIHTALGMQLLGLLCCHRPIRHGRGERRPWAYRGPIGHDGAAERRCPCPLLMRRRNWVKQCTLSAIPISSGPMPPQRSATAASSPAARTSCSHPCTVPQSTAQTEARSCLAGGDGRPRSSRRCTQG